MREIVQQEQFTPIMREKKTPNSQGMEAKMFASVKIP